MSLTSRSLIKSRGLIVAISAGAAVLTFSEIHGALNHTVNTPGRAAANQTHSPKAAKPHGGDATAPNVKKSSAPGIASLGKGNLKKAGRGRRAQIDTQGTESGNVSPPAIYSSAYLDLNPFVRAYCDGLAVLPGSTGWNEWGCALFPGQTGGQPDFGWRQDYLVPDSHSPKYPAAANFILTNAGYRPIFYMDPPNAMRKGYGRPWDWTPDPNIDDPIFSGWISPYNKSIVVGHDVQHISLKFLAALATDNSNTAFTNEAIMAKAFMWRYAAMVAGQLRTDYFKTTIHSSREVGRILDFAVDCVNNALLDDQDAGAVLDWVKNAVLPSIYPTGVGFIYDPSQQGYKPEPQLGAVDYWFPWQDGLEAAGLDRLGRYLIAYGTKEYTDLGTILQMKARLIASNTANVISHDGNCPKAVGVDGKIAWVGDEGYGYGAWCYRALRISGQDGKADVVFQRYQNKPDWWCWLVEPDGSYNPLLSIGK
ncbi:MAG: hypothetical protein HY286_18215 [Planctomycetes bacterium]|nr:hypothetical protein [Planctomycetota bacterium]